MNLKFEAIKACSWQFKLVFVSLFSFCSELHHFSFICFISGEGLSASRLSLRTGLSASNLSLRGESPLSLLLSHLLPSSRAGTPAGSRCTTPVPTPQNSPPSSPSISRLTSRSSQQSQLQAPELLVSPASGDIPTVVIHPPEEDLEALKGQEQKKEENVDITPGNYSKSSMCGAFCLLITCTWNAFPHLALAAYVDNAYNLFWLLHVFFLYTILHKRTELLKILSYKKTTDKTTHDLSPFKIFSLRFYRSRHFEKNMESFISNLLICHDFLKWWLVFSDISFTRWMDIHCTQILMKWCAFYLVFDVSVQRMQYVLTLLTKIGSNVLFFSLCLWEDGGFLMTAWNHYFKTRITFWNRLLLSII